MHETVRSAISAVMEALERLAVDHPGAVEEPSIAHVCQKSWIDDIGAAYSESVDVAVLFRDFQVMTAWILMQPYEMFHTHVIEWSLSQELKDDATIALSVQAVRDARRKAEIFATAAGLSITGMESLEDPRVEEPEHGPSEPTADTYPGVLDDLPLREIVIAPPTIQTEVSVVAHFTAEPEIEHASQAQSVRPAQAHRPGSAFFAS